MKRESIEFLRLKSILLVQDFIEYQIAWSIIDKNGNKRIYGTFFTEESDAEKFYNDKLKNERVIGCDMVKRIMSPYQDEETGEVKCEVDFEFLRSIERNYPNE